MRNSWNEKNLDWKPLSFYMLFNKNFVFSCNKVRCSTILFLGMPIFLRYYKNVNDFVTSKFSAKVEMHSCYFSLCWHYYQFICWKLCSLRLPKIDNNATYISTTKIIHVFFLRPRTCCELFSTTIVICRLTEKLQDVSTHSLTLLSVRIYIIVWC